MKRIKTLVFDLNEQQGWHDLQHILENAPRRAFEIRREVIEVDDSAKVAASLANVPLNFAPDLTFLISSREPDQNLVELVGSIRGKNKAPLIAVLTTSESLAIETMLDSGVSDFLTPPLRPSEVLPRVWRLLQRKTEDAAILSAKAKLRPRQFIGQSPRFLAEVEKIPAIARCDACALITGDTGTGKEVCAKAIHHLSHRADKPFVAVNCGALPVELVENELFGHEAGAFTSAANASTGLIQDADGGTLFLDEIDSLPLLAQVKLLRFLQDKEYRALGSRKIRKADIRVIAATNASLAEAVCDRRFRQDLFYRINVINITLPPLRERDQDIVLLACHFLDAFSAEFSKPCKRFSSEALQALVSYPWPGNVRELENVVERAVVLSTSETLEAADLQLPDRKTGTPLSFQQLKAKVISEFERQYIRTALLQHGNIAKAARAAGKNRRAFWELMRKHNIKPLGSFGRYPELQSPSQDCCENN